ncbi:hypothetical protein RCL1_004757 [Eukaryota sp. TZLM3-RCL]
MTFKVIFSSPRSRFSSLHLLDDKLVVCDSESGTILNVEDSSVFSNTVGSPFSITKSTTGTFVIADKAHKALLSLSSDEKLEVLCSDFWSKPFLGPHALVYDGSRIFFSDPGFFGDSGLLNPKGSIFVLVESSRLLMPIAHNCLAYPSGLALSASGNALFCTETGANRVLKFYNKNGSWIPSVFIHLNGRVGPVAVACDVDDSVYVACTAFSPDTSCLLKYDSVGNLICTFELPFEQITGLLVKDGSVFVSSVDSVFELEEVE